MNGTIARNLFIFDLSRIPAAFVIVQTFNQARSFRDNPFFQDFISRYLLLFIAACILAGLVSSIRALYHPSHY